jgi:hypothetical protein
MCACACIDMLRGPGTNGGVTTGSKLVIRGIPPTASKWTPIWLREGSQCPNSRSRRRVFRRTHPQYLAPPGDACQSGADASRHALHGDGRAPGVPFRPRQPDAGEGVALRVFGRKAGCGSYPKGRRSIVPNVHGPRLARRLPAEQGASKTHAFYPGVWGIERAFQLFRCAGGNFRSAIGRRTDGWLQGLFGRKADSPVHTRRGEGPSFQMLGEPPRAGAGRDLRCGVPAGP